MRYYPWHGRGFVQLAWEDNYIKAGQRLDIDLISDPDCAMDPQIATDVLVIGSREGWLTGKRLRDYITSASVDFRGARRIINGTNADAQIAEIATDYLAALTPVTVPDYPHIRLGSRGAAVKQAQALLSARGLLVGAMYGVFGPRTDAAARAFQRSEGLPPDGIIDPKSWAALIPNS